MKANRSPSARLPYSSLYYLNSGYPSNSKSPLLNFRINAIHSFHVSTFHPNAALLRGSSLGVSAFVANIVRGSVQCSVFSVQCSVFSPMFLLGAGGLGSARPGGRSDVAARDFQCKFTETYANLRNLAHVLCMPWNCLLRIANHCLSVSYIAGYASRPFVRAAHRAALDEYLQGVEVKELAHRRERAEKTKRPRKKVFLCTKHFTTRGVARMREISQRRMRPVDLV